MRDLVAANALGGSNLLGQTLNVEADRLFYVDDFALPQHIEIRHHDSVEPVAALAGLAFEPHHRNLLDERRLQVVRFDLFRIHILTVAEDNHLFLAPGEKKIAVSIEVAQVAGQEPSVAHHCCRSIGAVPVSLHHHGSA